MCVHVTVLYENQAETSLKFQKAQKLEKVKPPTEKNAMFLEETPFLLCNLFPTF